MENRKILILIALLAIFFVACEKDETADLSRITNYPTFKMTGDAVIFHQLGDPFTDPGVIATEGGGEIPVSVSVSGDHQGHSGTEIDVNVTDHYIITYSATNSDGFDGTATRHVYVFDEADLVTSIEGLYIAGIVRNGSTSAQYQNLEYMMIWPLGSNTYSISDAIGGYYDMGRGYGSNYRATGMTITANSIPNNDFSSGGPIGVGAFGGSLDLDYMNVDAGAKTIVFSTTWDAGYEFVVTLTQVGL